MTREEDLDPQIRNFFEEVMGRIEHLEGELEDLESRMLKLEKAEVVSSSGDCQPS